MANTISKEWKFGVISEDAFTLRSPRMVDEWFETLPEAFEAAGAMVENGTGKVSIVRCRYSKKNDSWYEVVSAGVITVDASDWMEDEEEEAA